QGQQGDVDMAEEMQRLAGPGQLGEDDVFEQPRQRQEHADRFERPAPPVPAPAPGRAAAPVRGRARLWRRWLTGGVHLVKIPTFEGGHSSEGEAQSRGHSCATTVTVLS